MFGNGLSYRWEVSEFDRFVRIRRSDRRGSTSLPLRTEVETVCLFPYDAVVTRGGTDARRLGSASTTSQTLSGLRVVLSSASAMFA